MSNTLSLSSIIDKTSKYFLGEEKSLVSKKSANSRYKRNKPSFPDEFSIVDFCDEKNIFLLDDGVSVGSGIEITAIQSEGMSDETLNKLYDKLVDTFSTVLPCETKNPWTMQIFVNDEYGSEKLESYLEKNIDEELKDDPLTQEYISNTKSLLGNMSRKEGAFIDPLTDKPYRYRERKTRILFYKREEDNVALGKTIEKHIKTINKVKKKLKSTGIDLRTLKGKHFYEWFVNWFNPNGGKYGSPQKILKKFPYPEDKSVGFSHVQDSLFCEPISNPDDRYIDFDLLKHRVLFFSGLKKRPEIGIISREKKQINDNHQYALLDTLPEGSIYTIQVVFEHQDNIESHITKISKRIIGNGVEADKARANLSKASDEIIKGNNLYWATQALYIRGETVDELDEIEDNVSDLFATQAGMKLESSVYDEHHTNSYITLMPFNYDFEFSRNHLCYENLIYSSEMAALLPIYGRFRGAKNMSSLLFFNRLGEDVRLDLLDKQFISFNSHMAVFGNSGFGKSVLATYLSYSLMATKNARIILFEMGNSFDGFTELCRAKGKKVHQMLFTNDKSKVRPINPFCEAYKALDDIKSIKDSVDIESEIEKLTIHQKLNTQVSTEDKEADDHKRDYISELVVVLRTMITQANAKEEAEFTIADEALLIDVLCDSIVKSIKAGNKQLLTEHIVKELEEYYHSETNSKKKSRIHDFKERLRVYITQPSLREQFNKESEPLEDFDLLHVDIGAIKDQPGKIALVMLSLLPKIISLCEAQQATKRPTFLEIDESHIQFEIPSVVKAALLIAKVARKLGLWIVPITQNPGDFKSEVATRILSLCENYVVGNISEDDITTLQTFRKINQHEQSLIHHVTSSKGKYSEAVFLGSKYQGAFRIMLPRFLLALAMTEKSEKAERASFIKTHGVIGGAREMAKKLEAIEVEKEIDDEEMFVD